jgi:hypothetical protein
VAPNGPYCANTALDANNCGTCGNVCEEGQTCTGGLCLPNQGELAFWPFDPSGNVFGDASGNGHAIGPIGPLAISAGYSGGGALFTGPTSFLVTNSTNPLNLNGSFTVEAWVNVPAGLPSGGVYGLFGECPTKVAHNCFMFELRPYVLYADFWLDGGTKGAIAIQPNTWHHVAVSYDAVSQTRTLFVDGQADKSSTTVPPFQGTPTSVTIGATEGTSYNLPVGAHVDEVRVYGYARSAADIQSDATLTADYTLDGNALDVGPNHLHGLESNGSWVQGRDHQALAFTPANGTQVQIVNGTAPGLVWLGQGGSFTVEGWVYPTATFEQASIFQISQMQNAGTGFCAPLLGITGGDAYAEEPSSSSAATAVVAASALALNSWSHVAMTYDSNTSTLALYVNGASAGTQTGASSYFQSSPVWGRIGSNGSGGSNCALTGGAPGGAFTGDMQDLKIYSRAKAAAEIQTDFATQ